MDWERIAEALVAQGLMDEQRWVEARIEQQRWGGDFARILLDKGWVYETDLLRVMSEVLKIKAVDLDDQQIPREVTDLVPLSIVEQHNAIPVRRQGNFLDVGMLDPVDALALDDLRVQTQLNIRPYLTGPGMLERALGRYYGRVRVGGYAVDPRVTSGTFLSSDVLANVKATETSTPQRAETEPPDQTDARLAALEKRSRTQAERITMLESLLTRDEDVLRRLFGFLIDKGVANREEIVRLLK